MIYKEHLQQRELFTWWRTLQQLNKIPPYYLLYANRNTHQLNMMQSLRAKAEGMTKGIPDIFLAVARHGYHGLYLEMKASHLKPRTNKAILGGLSPEQLEVITYLRKNNYKAVVVYSADEAIKTIENYLNLGEYYD